MGAPSITFCVILLAYFEKTVLSAGLYARNPFLEKLNLSSNSLPDAQSGFASSAPSPQIIVLPPGSEPANFDYQNLDREQSLPRPIVISGYHYYPPYADYPSFYQPPPSVQPGIIQKPLQQEFVSEYPSRVSSNQINCHPSATLNVVSRPSSYETQQQQQQSQIQQQQFLQQSQQEEEQHIQQQLLEQQYIQQQQYPQQQLGYPQQQVVADVPVETQKIPTPHNSLKTLCVTPRGQYPTNECNKYVNCWDDSVVEQYCPKGLVFNPKGYCDFSFNVECGRKPIVDVPLSSPVEVVVQQSGQYQQQQLQQQQLLQQQSQQQQLQQQQLQQQQLQQQQQQPTIIPISATWAPSTSAPTTIQNVLTVSQPIQEPVVAHVVPSTLPPVDPKLGAKCLKSRGQFPTDSCNKYINCWDGNAVEEECPEGLLFSAKGYCDYAFNVDCLGRTQSGVNKPVQPFYQNNQIYQVQSQGNHGQSNQFGQSNPFLQSHLQGQANQQLESSHNLQSNHLINQSSQSNHLNQLNITQLNQASIANQNQGQQNSAQSGYYGSNPFLQSHLQGQSNNQQSQSSQNTQSQNNLTQNSQSSNTNAVPSNNFLQSNPFLQAHFQGQSNKNSQLAQSESHEIQSYNKHSINRVSGENNLAHSNKQQNHSIVQSNQQGSNQKNQSSHLTQSHQQNQSSLGQSENKIQSNYQQQFQQSNHNTQTLQQHLQASQSSQSNLNIQSNHLIDQQQYLAQPQYIVQPINQYSPSYLALTNQPVQNYHLQSNYQSNQNAEINYSAGMINDRIKGCECLIDSGTFRNKNNCSQFYTCIDNKVVAKYECPVGLSFNDVIGVCDYSYRVDCTHEPYIYIPLKSNSFHKLPNEILQKVPAGLIDSKAGCNLGSVFKLNNECSVAAICKTGVVEIVECPTGFAYDSPSDKCLVPYLARC